MRRFRRLAPLFALLAAVVGMPAAASDALSEPPRIGTDSGLPVPRFVALAEARVNGRRRADVRAPIDWIYQRPGLPLQVIAESGPWRRVRDPDGGEVWIHATSLENRATIYVRGGEDREATMRRRASNTAQPIAIMEAGVVADVMACEGDWLRVRAEDRTGWVIARDVWGARVCP